MAEITFPKPIPFQQNGRNCWVTTITVKKATELTLPAEGQQTSMFEIRNRGVDDSHVKSITRYLGNPHWALPALILAASPGTMPETVKGSLVCDAASLRVLDGQHRIKGMSGQVLSGNEKIQEQELAVVIIEVKDGHDQGQIWQDFSKNKPISGSWKDAVDNATPFVIAAKMAAEQSRILKGRTKIGKTKIADSDPELITISGLKQITSTIAIGIQRAASPKNQSAYQPEAKQNELRDRVTRFFDEFLTECKPNYRLVEAKDQFGQTIKSLRNTSCAYDTPILNLLADVHARWLEEDKPEEQLAQYAGNMSLSKTAPENWLSRNNVYDTGKGTYAPPKEKKLWANASISMTKEADAI